MATYVTRIYEWIDTRYVGLCRRFITQSMSDIKVPNLIHFKTKTAERIILNVALSRHYTVTSRAARLNVRIMILIFVIDPTNSLIEIKLRKEARFNNDRRNTGNFWELQSPADEKGTS